MTIARYRSTLFIPCGNAKALGKAPGLSCDALIFDLEDAVGPDGWANALAGLVATLEAGGFQASQVLVRIDPRHTAATVDALSHCMRSGTVSGIVVPKVETPEALHAVRDALPRGTGVWAMIETPLGVVNLAAIASVVGLKGLIAGPNDLRKGLRTRPMDNRQDIIIALSHIVLHARAHRLIALDGVYNQYTDEIGFGAECDQGRSLGFDGKTLIHPSQIAAANRAFFSPSDAEIAWARAVVAAFAGSGDGVLSVNGEMVERLHLEQAQGILSVAELK
ncbi:MULTISPECIES: CoA ester lyase [Asticcacaulis]|uniref:HpcH/HpaI aldolase/citrate lyase family protein n=1 Tax=Asticcacaulis TaxID=76890 RepID=UPI001AE1CFA5|nr:MULTISPECIES: CoA ester lyase [Asticcacaulis]MBP2159406.1 citrate lyase subunit beta/citryl-CoA lyase/(3S)-malyl-CoA thioesterase [Asticcacaulis solisilvae]MDR6800451.1 citrate lyase subunit beta/citryl-CoA lyase/(3S)-malyl-CoA thioesterase [Asticcacaulis sp. BE141]